MRITERWITILLAATLAMTMTGCGSKFEHSFEVVFLSYGTPGVPYGSLVVAGYAPDSGWSTRYHVELARQATLLFPPPYQVKEGIPYLSISSGFQDKNSALWVATPDNGGGSHFVVKMPQRCVLLWTNNPSADAAVVLYANQTGTSVRTSREGRELVSLTQNACSLAVVRYSAPEEFNVIGSASYARPAWFSNTQLGYVSKSGYLIARSPDSGLVDTLASGVESFAVAPQVGVYAVCYSGDSIQVFDGDGAAQGAAIQGGSVPALAADGRWLAYHRNDQTLVVRDLDSAADDEVGVGYPINWTPEGHLLLYFERRVVDKKKAVTVFHVCAPLESTEVTLPANGDLVDAVLLR